MIPATTISRRTQFEKNLESESLWGKRRSFTLTSIGFKSRTARSVLQSLLVPYITRLTELEKRLESCWGKLGKLVAAPPYVLPTVTGTRLPRPYHRGSPAVTWKQVRLLVAVASAAGVKGESRAPSDSDLLEAALSKRDARGAHLAFTEMRKQQAESRPEPKICNSLLQCEFLALLQASRARQKGQQYVSVYVSYLQLTL